MKKNYQKATCKVRTIKLCNMIATSNPVGGQDGPNGGSRKAQERTPFMEEEF